MDVFGAGGAGEEKDVVDGFGVGGVPVETFRRVAVGEDGIAQMLEADVRDGSAGDFRRPSAWNGVALRWVSVSNDSRDARRRESQVLPGAENSGQLLFRGGAVAQNEIEPLGRKLLLLDQRDSLPAKSGQGGVDGFAIVLFRGLAIFAEQAGALEEPRGKSQADWRSSGIAVSCNWLRRRSCSDGGKTENGSSTVVPVPSCANVTVCPWMACGVAFSACPARLVHAPPASAPNESNAQSNRTDHRPAPRRIHGLISHPAGTPQGWSAAGATGHRHRPDGCKNICEGGVLGGRDDSETVHELEAKLSVRGTSQVRPGAARNLSASRPAADFLNSSIFRWSDSSTGMVPAHDSCSLEQPSPSKSSSGRMAKRLVPRPVAME